MISQEKGTIIKSEIIAKLFNKLEFFKQTKKNIHPESTAQDIQTLISTKATNSDQLTEIILPEIRNVFLKENLTTEEELPRNNMEVLTQLKVDLQNISEVGALRLKDEYLKNFQILLQYRTEEAMRSSIFDLNMKLKESNFFVVAEKVLGVFISLLSVRLRYLLESMLETMNLSYTNVLTVIFSFFSTSILFSITGFTFEFNGHNWREIGKVFLSIVKASNSTTFYSLINRGLLFNQMILKIAKESLELNKKNLTKKSYSTLGSILNGTLGTDIKAKISQVKNIFSRYSVKFFNSLTMILRDIKLLGFIGFSGSVTLYILFITRDIFLLRTPKSKEIERIISHALEVLAKEPPKEMLFTLSQKILTLENMQQLLQTLEELFIGYF